MLVGISFCLISIFGITNGGGAWGFSVGRRRGTGICGGSGAGAHCFGADQTGSPKIFISSATWRSFMLGSKSNQSAFSEVERIFDWLTSCLAFSKSSGRIIYVPYFLILLTFVQCPLADGLAAL